MEESHQQSKIEASATAASNVRLLMRLGLQIKNYKAIRHPIKQIKIGVPSEALDSHGWCTYTIESPDKEQVLKFIHNVNGRKPYVQGTMLALHYLKIKSDEGERGQMYDMGNVLMEFTRGRGLSKP